MGRSFVFNNAQSLEGSYLNMGLSFGWFVFHIPPNKRVCSSFDGCLVPVYECLFSTLGFRIPFNDFEVDVLNHLRIPNSHPCQIG